jgi:peptidoglycan/xylan/chitin deacetylase (PgdA/CDA1 family)
VRRVAQAGHAIGNHTWDHPSVLLISGNERRAQIRACAQALAPYGQRIFRPPYGHQNFASRFDSLYLGYQVVTWNVHAYDWLDHEAGWMADRLIHNIRPGSIVLLHDTLWQPREKRAEDRRPLLAAVDILLGQLAEQMSFVTVPELLRRGRPQLRNWNRKDGLFETIAG